MFLKPNYYRNSKKGFTLVELSFVIVFLAIVFALVSFGRNIQTSSQVKSLIKESQKYLTAVVLFDNRYGFLPGDYPNAFEAFSGCGLTAAQCNGNGDGILDDGTVAADSEVLRFWQHLSLSGIIDGYYTGEASTSAPSLTVGENCPKAKAGFGNGGYAVGNVNYFSAVQDNTIFSKAGGYNALMFGVPASASDLRVLNGVITPSFAKNIDFKIDDGLPEYGKVMAFDGENNPLLTSYISENCLTGSEGSATYDESNRSDICHLIWEINF